MKALFQELAEAYNSYLIARVGLQQAINNVNKAIDDENEIDIGDIDPDVAEDYLGEEAEMLAAKYIVTLERSLYGQDEYEDKDYLLTGLTK